MKRSPRKPRRSTGSRVARGRLSLQQLESRKLMAADIGALDATVSIAGTPMDDVAEVYVESDRVFVKVSTYDETGNVVGEAAAEYAAVDVGRIVFVGGDGNDVLVNETSIPVVARGGAGDDTLMGGSGDDLIVAGAGNDLVLGGGGDDLVLAGPGENVVIESTNENDGDAEVSTDADTDAEVEVEADAEVDPEAEADSQTADAEAENPMAGEGESTSEPIAGNVDSAEADDIAVGDEMNCPLSPEPLDAVLAVEVAEQTESTNNAPVEELDASSETEPTSETEPESEAAPTPENEMDSTNTAQPVELIDVPQMPANDPMGLDNEDVVIPADDPIEEADEDAVADVTDTVDDSTPAGDAADQTDDQPETDDDIIFGGSGDDWLFGGGGRDMIFGNMSPLEDELLRGVIAGRFRL